MEPNPGQSGIQLSGRWQYRLRNLLSLYWSSLAVTCRRAVRGPLLPGWTWTFEVGTRFLRAQTEASFAAANQKDSREYQDALAFHSPALARVAIEPVTDPVRGAWFRPETEARGRTLLYLHGGGYAYYPRAYRGLIAQVALSARAKTFALDYRLTPEHPFPAQLEDARAALAWLLASGADPRRVVVVGDSAGGNLTLALLLALKDSDLPLPALAVCIAPWVDLANTGGSMTANARYDWVSKPMADRWAGWLCRDADPRNPLVSPIHADLRGLPPIYVQAGRAEVLYDMIAAFAARAREQGGEVTLDAWEHMNHDFQIYGDLMPQSREALARLGKAIEDRVPA